MYSTCVFCHGTLGKNEELEPFPVGRRIAFDPDKGRLWAICDRCRRWNLAPLEERWEALEACERLFRGATLRVTGDKLGVARIQDHLELVRIGSTALPEFSGWRYGSELARRKWTRVGELARGGVKAWWANTWGSVRGGPFYVGGLAFYVLAPPTWPFIGSTAAVLVGAGLLNEIRGAVRSDRSDSLDEVWEPLGTIVASDGEPFLLRPIPARQARLEPTDGDDRWSVHIPPQHVDMPGRQRAVEVVGQEAVRVLRLALPSVNRFGGSDRMIRRAVAQIEEVGDPGAYFAAATEQARRQGHRYSPLAGIPTEMRLAMEIAANEERERLAWEGELWVFEQEWKQAEEIAAIADSLLIPEHVQEFLDRYKRSPS